MKRGRPITVIGQMARMTFKNTDYGNSARTFQTRMAMMRAFARLTDDGESDLAVWFMDNRRHQVLAAIGRLPQQYMTDAAKRCRNLSYDDGSPGPVTGLHMLDFIKAVRALHGGRNEKDMPVKKSGP
jgi:hypothetical protein